MLRQRNNEVDSENKQSDSYHPVLIYLNSDGKSFKIHFRTPTLLWNQFYKLCTDDDPIHPIFKEALKASTHEDVWRILHFIKLNKNNCQASIGKGNGNILHRNNIKYGHALFIGFGYVKGAAHQCSIEEMIRFVEKVDKNECRKVHITNEYTKELAGHATVYTHGHGLFNETKALLTGKRKIFANLRAWWNNDGILLANTRALLAGKRPFMVNTRNYLFGNSLHLDEKSKCTSNLHPKSTPQKAARKAFVEGMSKATLEAESAIAKSFFHFKPTKSALIRSDDLHSEPPKTLFEPNLVDQIFDLAGISNPEKSKEKKKLG